MKRKLLSIFLTLCMMLTLLPTALAEGDTATYPDGVTKDTFPEGKLIYVDQVSSGEGHYFATFKEALSASASGATLYCKENETIPNGENHPAILHSLTVYGNGATQVCTASQPAGEATFSIEESNDGNKFTADVTLNIYNLKNATVWGTRKTAHTFTLNMENCGSSATVSTGQRVYLNGETGSNNITIKNCDFTSANSDTVVYSNANGTITIENCTFNNIGAAINLNHKANGAQTVYITGCTFANCGKASSTYHAPIRVVNSGSGSETVSVSGCTITGTKGDNGDILIGDGRNSKTSNEVSLTVTNTAAKVQIQAPGYYNTADNSVTESTKTDNSKLIVDTLTASSSATFTNATAAFEIAEVDGTKYTSLAAAIDAAAAGKTIKLLRDVNNAEGMTIGSGKNFTLDFDGHTYTVNKPGAGSTNTETAGFQLLKDSTITFQNGTLNVSSDNLTPATEGKNILHLFQNYANLTLSNMIVDGTNLYGTSSIYTMSNALGNIVINNSKIIAKTGHIAFDTSSFEGYTGSNVTIKGTSEIVGDIEVGKYDSADTSTLKLTIESGTIKGEIKKANTATTDKLMTQVVSITGGAFTSNPYAYKGNDSVVVKFDSNGGTALDNVYHVFTGAFDKPTVERAGYTLTGWTESVGDDGVVTYTANWSRNYSSGGSSSSSSSNTSSSTVKNPDGSTTTTTTNKTTGTTTEVTKNTDGSVDTVITNKDGSTTETTQTSNGTTTTVETNKQGEVTDISASVSASAAREANKSGESVTLPVEGIEPVSASADAPEINVSIPSNSSSVTVEIPVENVTPGTVVVIVNEDGTETIVPTSKVTENGIEVTLTENATIKVVDNSKSFSDVPSDNVFSDEIASMSARGIMVGKEDGSFDVHGSVTLNQIANVAGRVSGAVPTEDYEGGIAWGEANGLATGDAPATRGQVILALYAAAGSPDTMDTGKLSAYSDGAGVPSEMLSAVLWAVEHGILKGTDVGTLDLGANVTRGQAAAFAGRALNAIG